MKKVRVEHKTAETGGTDPKEIKAIAIELANRATQISNMYCNSENMDGWSMHDLVASIAGGAKAMADNDMLTENPGNHDQQIKERLYIIELYLQLLEKNEEARRQELISNKRGDESAWLRAIEARRRGLSHHVEYAKSVLSQFNYL